ncbi:MAG: hypothetical protein H6R33_707 [Actinobacteria bacterium]|nr:hypothetical protein [Actinomycetota bacterium]
MWPRVAGPTGTVMALPVSMTSVPRITPSVGFMDTARTRPPPRCWATSATTRWGFPSTRTSNSRAWLISGIASGGNSTSTTGPATLTMRPLLTVSPWFSRG